MATFLGFWVFLGITCAIVCGGLVMGGVTHAAPWGAGGQHR